MTKSISRTGKVTEGLFFFPELKVEGEILLNEKTRLAVTAALDNMMGKSRDVHPWTTWHSNPFA